MRILNGCFLLLLLVVSISAQSQGVRVIAERANLRSTPSNSGEVLIEIPRGAEFDVLKVEGAWYLVQTSQYVGWLHGNALELVESNTSRRSNNYPRPQPTPTGFRPVFPTEDVGVDLALVTAYSTNLMDGDKVVLRLRQGQLLALVERDAIDGWYSVVDVDSSSSGYVSQKDIEIKLSKNRKSGSLLEKTYSGSEDNPSLKVINGTNRVIYLTLNGKHYEMKPNAELNFNFAPGSIKYYAATPGVLPDFGDDYLRKGYIYSWEFYIATK